MGALGTLAGILMGLVGPIVVRTIIALGFTVLTFTGVAEIVSTLVGIAQEKWSAMPAGVLQLAALSGIPTGLGMVFGALAAVWAIQQASGLKRFIFKS